MHLKKKILSALKFWSSSTRSFFQNALMRYIQNLFHFAFEKFSLFINIQFTSEVINLLSTFHMGTPVCSVSCQYCIVDQYWTFIRRTNKARHTGTKVVATPSHVYLDGGGSLRV